jgi:hypothetical protein
MPRKHQLYLNTREVALLLHCSEGELIHAVSCNQPVRGVTLPHPARSGRTRRFDYHQVMEAIKSGATGPTH